MSNSMQSLVQSGTKVWLDSIDPKEVERNRTWGATGATSNPIIISDLLKTGRFDTEMGQLFRDGLNDEAIAWAMTDRLVSQAQKVFSPVHEVTLGNDGYVSFELDPLIEDTELKLPVAERTRRYIELGKKWAAGHRNRMIKVPNTPGGLGALEELAANGLTLNITLTFSPAQYIAARDAKRKARRSGARSTPSNRCTAFSSAGSTSIPRATFPSSLRRPKARSASSMPSASGR